MRIKKHRSRVNYEGPGTGPTCPTGFQKDVVGVALHNLKNFVF